MPPRASKPARAPPPAAVRKHAERRQCKCTECCSAHGAAGKRWGRRAFFVHQRARRLAGEVAVAAADPEEGHADADYDDYGGGGGGDYDDGGEDAIGDEPCKLPAERPPPAVRCLLRSLTHLASRLELFLLLQMPTTWSTLAMAAVTETRREALKVRYCVRESSPAERS
jgi:hypothetical protein